MNHFSGRGQPLDADSSLPLFTYKNFLRIIYLSVLFQASLCYVFFGLGVLFSSTSYHNHMVGLYALFFGLVSMLYQFSYRPVVEKVLLFFPRFEDDVVKHTFYFLVGVPGLTPSDSFQYQLGSILFTLVGFVGTLVSLRYQNPINSYMTPEYPNYQQA